MTRLRLAFFTPLRPQRSGVSDYSEELLPWLAGQAEVDLVVGPSRPDGDGALARHRIIEAREFLGDPSRWDAAVYQVGNSLDHHGYMIPCLARVPGIVVLHDCCLQHLMLGLTLRRGDLAGLERALAPVYGARARGLAWRLLLGVTDPNALFFAGPLVAASRAVIVHGEHARQRVLAGFPAARLRVVPMGVPLEERAMPAATARERWRLGADDPILASVSTLAHTKRLDLAVRVLVRLRERWPRVRLLVLGGGSLGARTRRLIARLGLEEAVTRTGWLPGEEYRGLIQAADVVLDLRHPSGGETSASLLRALAAGKPAVLSAAGAFLDVPDDCCRKVPVGGAEVEAVTEAIAGLLGDPDTRRRLGAAAQGYARAHHRLEQAAAGLVDVAREVIAAPGPAPVAGWSPATAGAGPGRLTIAATYRLCRAGYLLRLYGVGDTARRIGEELRARPAP